MNFKYSLKYGDGTVELSLETAREPYIVEPNSVAAAADPQGIVRLALENPVGSPLPDFRDAKSVAIAINDKTRPVPHQILIPPLLGYLSAAGFRPESISFLVATGTHKPMAKHEFPLILPQDVVDGFSVFSHDCDDLDLLRDYGYTQYKTPVLINSRFASADFKVVVGNIEPHHFMGFSGGAKSASIGLAGRKTINANHAMLARPDARIGEYENNPMRQDVEEIGDLIKIDLALNVILNEDKKVVAAFSGTPRNVMQAGIPLCKEICQVKVPQLYDIVVASPGGSPKDINLYQSQKALTNAAQIVKTDGVIILTAACPEGSGSQSFEGFMAGVDSHRAVFDKFEETGFSVGPHKAYQIARIAEKATIILVSGMQPELVKSFLITPSATIDNALQRAFSLSPPQPSIAVMPLAVSTIPLLSN